MRNLVTWYNFMFAVNQGWPGFLGIQYIWVFYLRYRVFLCLKLGIKYSLAINYGYKVCRAFLILVFYMSFSIIFGILEGLFRVHVFWYSTAPPWPTLVNNVNMKSDNLSHIQGFLISGDSKRCEDAYTNSWYYCFLFFRWFWRRSLIMGKDVIARSKQTCL